jgi:hypothetical protein
MEINTKLKYNFKDNCYHIEVKDEDGNVIPYVTSRVYENEFEAEIASGILKMFFSRIETPTEFDLGEFDFTIRAVLRLIDAPGKW